MASYTVTLIDEEGDESKDGNGEGNGEHGNINDDGSKAEGDEAKKGSGNQKGGAKAPKNLEELNDRQKEQLKKAIDKQSQLVNQETRKTGVSKKMQKQMSALENSGTEIRESKYEEQNYKTNY